MTEHEVTRFNILPNNECGAVTLSLAADSSLDVVEAYIGATGGQTITDGRDFQVDLGDLYTSADEDGAKCGPWSYDVVCSSAAGLSSNDDVNACLSTSGSTLSVAQSQLAVNGIVPGDYPCEVAASLAGHAGALPHPAKAFTLRIWDCTEPAFAFAAEPSVDLSGAESWAAYYDEHVIAWYPRTEATSFVLALPDDVVVSPHPLCFAIDSVYVEEASGACDFPTDFTAPTVGPIPDLLDPFNDCAVRLMASGTHIGSASAEA